MKIKHTVKISLTENENIIWDKFTDMLDIISNLNNAEEKEMSDEATTLVMNIRDFWDKWSDEGES